MPVTNSVEPAHRYPLGIPARLGDGVRSCSPALAMLSRKSPANAGVPTLTITIHAMTMRSVLIWLPPKLCAKLQPARQDVSRRHSERRCRAGLRGDALERGVVGHVQGVEEHAERCVRPRGECEVLLRAEIDEVDVVDAPVARIR